MLTYNSSFLSQYLLVLALSFHCFSPAIAQILANPDFESGEQSNRQATAWVLGSEELPISLGKGADGKGHALMLHSDQPQGQHFSQLATFYAPSLRQYKLSFKVKPQTKEGESRGFIWINLLDADSAMALETGWGNFEGTKDWETFSRTFFVPGNTRAIRVGGSITGKGTLWLDDFELEEVPYEPEKIHLSAEAEEYIQTVVDSMRMHALYRDRLNFEDIRQIIRFNAQGAEQAEDTYQAIKKGIPYLMDHHSNFFSSAEVKQYFGDVDIKELIGNEGYLQRDNLNIDSLKASLGFSSGKLIDNEVGYLSISSFTHLYLAAVRMYSDSIQQLIREFDQKPLKGWVIDLRNNYGGATHPMVVGIGPLLQNTNKGYYVDANHEIELEFYYKDGAIYDREISTTDTTTISILHSGINYEVKDQTLPIAVLIGPRSASAAEGVATILAGEPNVKMFGRKTAGLTTGNDFMILSDGAVLNLTTSFLANRHMQVYERGIEPDVKIEENHTQGSGHDSALQAALEWIKSQ